MNTLELEDGYHRIPHGKLVSVVTVLEMRSAPERDGRRLPPPWRLERLTGPDSLPRYRALYRTVGEEWLWFSRTVMKDDALSDILSNPDVLCFALTAGAGDAGILELDFRGGNDCELAFFGLTRAEQGHGIGGVLMDEALRLAFSRPIDRLWVHTCTHDAPGALAFYLHCGFTAIERQIELHDDYRLSGLLPETAAPHIPLLRP